MDEKNNNNEILIYQSQDGTIKVDVLFEGETVWLSQSQLSTLFGKSKSTISEHIKHIFEEGELDSSAVVRNFRTTAEDGKEYNTNYYNLDVIMNYFKELLERIREIRISERVFYQQIKDIYATSIDYDPSDEMTLSFYKEVQNKLLWAVCGKTAAELVYYRANASLPMMGLTSTTYPDKVLKADIAIGKNYLNEEEVKMLKLIVEQFLAFAEAQAMAHKPLYMKDWIEKLKLVLTMNEKSILEDAGRISHQLAVQKAGQEYTQYKEVQRASERLNSIKELDEDIKRLKRKDTDTGKKNE